MTQPVALDLFCGAGGVAMGLKRAGFYVIGVDNRPQPRYAGDEFILADAMTYPLYMHNDLDGYALYWASPPCKKFVSLNKMWNAKEHDDLVTPTRERFKELRGVPWVIENVFGSPLMPGCIRLCGSAFNLGTETAELRRHRYFESNVAMIAPPCQHGQKQRVIGVYGGHGRDRRRTESVQDFPTDDRRKAMGIDWMTGEELSQAIPPAYSEWIGRRIVACHERTGS